MHKSKKFSSVFESNREKAAAEKEAKEEAARLKK